MNMTVQQAAVRLRTRRGAICASPAFAADLRASLVANVAAPVPSNVPSVNLPSSPMRGAVGSAASSASAPLRPRLTQRRNALTPNSRRELRVMLQLPVSPAPSPMASPLYAPSMTRSISASFARNRDTPDSERSAASSTETPLQSRRGSVVSSADETPGSSSVLSPRASVIMSFFGAGSPAAAGPRAESPMLSSPQPDSDVTLQFAPPRVRNLERRRAVVNHHEFFATIPEQWQAGAVPAPTSPRIRARRKSSPFVAAAAAASRSIFQVLTAIPPMSLAHLDPNTSPIEGAMDGAFVSPSMWSPSPK